MTRKICAPPFHRRCCCDDKGLTPCAAQNAGQKCLPGQMLYVPFLVDGEDVRFVQVVLVIGIEGRDAQQAVVGKIVDDYLLAWSAVDTAVEFHCGRHMAEWIVGRHCADRIEHRATENHAVAHVDEVKHADLVAADLHRRGLMGHNAGRSPRRCRRGGWP